MAMTTAEKSREARLRRAAKRRGMELVRSPRRDRLALDYDGYKLVDAASGEAVYSFGFNGFGAGIDDIERWLMAGNGSRAVRAEAVAS